MRNFNLYFYYFWIKHKTIFLFLGIWFCIVPNNVFGQESESVVVSSCSQKLKEVEKDYEKGNIDRIPAKIDPCANSEEFTKIEKMQAYRLLILTYLYLDDQKNADKWMYNLLVLEPDYKPNKLADPIEYVKLFNNFSVNPWLSFGAFFGLNRSNAKSFHAYSVSNNETNPTSYKPSAGIQLGIIVDFLLKKKLFLTTELAVVAKSFTTNSNVLFDSYIINDESSSWFELPVSLKYVVGNYKIKPFVRVGAGVLLNNSSVSQIERRNKITDQVEITGPIVDLSTQRTALNFNVFAGGGIMYKLGYGNLFLDARYSFGFTNLVKQSERYTKMTELITNYGYLPDDFVLSSIQISLGYSYSFYKIKKNKIKFIVEE
ncbi:MAG: PorT family protein [Cytophagales bacterium]|nr:MAG: PorT family protein [Cytophagales bacterium]